MIQADALALGTDDPTVNPSPLLTEYTIAYIQLGIRTTKDLTQSLFVASGVGTLDTTIAPYTVDSNAVRAIGTAHCSIVAAAAAGVNVSTQLSALQTGSYGNAVATGGRGRPALRNVRGTRPRITAWRRGERSNEEIAVRWALGPVVAIATILAVAVSARNGAPSVQGRERLSSVPSGDSRTADEPPRFRCGNLSCDARREYCETLNTDVPSLPTTHACRPRPASCLPQGKGADVNCDCFPSGTRCDFCTVVRASGAEAFYRTCIGGR